jgi:mycothiol synthase
MNSATTGSITPGVVIDNGDKRRYLQAIWTASQDEDEPLGRPAGGWWSIADWATASTLLVAGSTPVGFAAIEHRAGATVAEARVGLLPGERSPERAARLLGDMLALAQLQGAAVVRLYTPEAATWITQAAALLGFQLVRTQHTLRRPADAVPFEAALPEGVAIRPLRDGEELALLAALNRAWTGSWNFRPITARALRHDLEGQREGMLVAVDEARPEQIIGTVHAILRPLQPEAHGNADAWISNLTSDPAQRGRGLGRALLAAGLAHLRRRRAGSVRLGVDGENTAALQLYGSAGFQIISSVQIFDRALPEGTATVDGLRHRSSRLYVPGKKALVDAMASEYDHPHQGEALRQGGGR